MHAHSIEDFRHSHVFLGHAHKRNERKRWTVIAICAVMMVAEIVGGLWFGSVALPADGLHMSTHAGALLIAALAYTYSRRYARDDRFAFGTGKLGDLAAFASAIILAMVVFERSSRSCCGWARSKATFSLRRIFCDVNIQPEAVAEQGDRIAILDRCGARRQVCVRFSALLKCHRVDTRLSNLETSQPIGAMVAERNQIGLAHAAEFGAYEAKVAPADVVCSETRSADSRSNIHSHRWDGCHFWAST
jgi:hypothetical protein